MKMPRSWDEVSIGKWKDLMSLKEDDILSLTIQRIAILTDLDPLIVRGLPIQEYKKLSSELSFLSDDLSRMKTELIFDIDGKKYGLIPDFTNITTGEFVDIESWKDDPYENMHLIAAVIYREVVYIDDYGYQIKPHTNKYFKKRAKAFLEKLPISKVYAAVVFFSILGLQFLEIIADSSQLANLTS